MTKKQARERKAEWSKALVEKRILRFDNGQRLISYPTIEARNAAFDAAMATGIPCEVV